MEFGVEEESIKKSGQRFSLSKLYGFSLDWLLLLYNYQMELEFWSIY